MVFFRSDSIPLLIFLFVTFWSFSSLSSTLFYETVCTKVLSKDQFNRNRQEARTSCFLLSQNVACQVKLSYSQQRNVSNCFGIQTMTTLLRRCQRNHPCLHWPQKPGVLYDYQATQSMTGAMVWIPSWLWLQYHLLTRHTRHKAWCTHLKARLSSTRERL